MLQLSQAGHPVHVRNPHQIAGIAPEEVAPHLWVYRDFARLPKEAEANAIYFIYYPLYACRVVPGNSKFIIYDCIDDDPSFAGQEDLMLSRADLVLCVSEQLLHKLRKKHQRLLFLPNGVDPEHYFPSGEALPPEMSRIRSTRESIIGFTGAFYSGWVDIELVYQIARANPKWRMVIIGESYRWDFANAPSNIVYLGQRPYQDLPKYLHGFDVGIIPFMDNQISRGADPVKLYEYLAAGLPVVSRDLPFVRKLAPPLVYSYDNQAECLASISRALSENGTNARGFRLAFARDNSWDQRAKKLLTELERLTWLELPED